MQRTASETACSARTCDRPASSKGLCATHYQRTRRGTPAMVDVLALGRDLALSQPCVANGCDRPVTKPGKGTCNAHYCRLREHGSYSTPKRVYKPRTERACTGCGEVKPVAEFTKLRSPGKPDRFHGQCKPCRVIYEGDRNYRIRTRYGVSQQEYLAMVEAQSGLCAVCEQPADVNRQHRKLYIDHCHETGKIRGLLCHGCNVSLGFMQDSPERLERAAAYLRERG